MPTAREPCPACAREEHRECWENDPPRGVEGIGCPCPHDRARYVVRRYYVDIASFGWGVWGYREARFTGGWFADERAAEATAMMLNDPEADPVEWYRLLSETGHPAAEVVTKAEPGGNVTPGSGGSS